MAEATTTAAGPVGERERIAELDILRGIALLGVLLMNFVAFAGAGLKDRYSVAETRLMTVEQLEDLVQFMEQKLSSVA